MAEASDGNHANSNGKAPAFLRSSVSRIDSVSTQITTEKLVAPLSDRNHTPDWRARQEESDPAQSRW